VDDPIPPSHSGNPHAPIRNTDNDPRAREPVGAGGADEVAEHLLGHLEVGYHAVFQWPDRGDVGRGAPEHRLGLQADGVDLAAGAVDRDDGGLGEDDATAFDLDQGVGGAEVDRHVAAAQGEAAEGVH
jgi:hypothetical protein